MLKRFVQLAFTLVGASAGYYLGPEFFGALQKSPLKFGDVPAPGYIGGALGAVIMFVATIWLSNNVVKWIRWSEERLIKIPAADGVFGALGLIFGLIVAFLIQQPLSSLPIPGVNHVLPFIFSGLFGYLGFRVGYKKRDELISVFTLGRQNKEGRNKKEGRETFEHKILDTSVIIDGRIADICRTGFLEGTLVIPSFVLEELQHIADSSDVLKRNRGRRGLDILNKIQKELNVKVIIYEGDFEEVAEVDSKLVKLAKVLSGKVVTNDFNLNKVCELQGVSVLNINDLANAVKPVVLPGEEINVQVIKDGKEHGQGVAYLDDGTMIVIEGGREYIGDRLDVLVTSVLQTSAGRMIFAKPKLLERAL
ncbi:PIN/TRAM domain-containing protein [Paenactinomyces guangxiensis]|uniref:PIN/TRAM domain-containing protein n=1 Tax=Paenactinomyces guangxiensis TaxID=1490290 RepID=A0A7W1WTQ5_9BACL|nr:PIN/TRAM domain-containing protein [Paenactinomyces guangxiensis]MBA4495862.1 PIN/TRAM domain-containing protein [Paenactinomyces guangxiensis]MBH8593001.1 PIN/TRAM domain-containing protein [Paenactinomyces guangxiensis]